MEQEHTKKKWREPEWYTPAMYALLMTSVGFIYFLTLPTEK